MATRNSVVTNEIPAQVLAFVFEYSKILEVFNKGLIYNVSIMINLFYVYQIR